MLLRLHNRTGLTIHTSEHVSSPSLAVSDVPVEMPAEAWEHTLACAPGLRPLVGADGGIEVTEVERVITMRATIAGEGLTPEALAALDEAIPGIIAEAEAKPFTAEDEARGRAALLAEVAAVKAANPTPVLVPKGKRR